MKHNGEEAQHGVRPPEQHDGEQPLRRGAGSLTLGDVKQHEQSNKTEIHVIVSN
jgi:hypothetical protein